MDSMIIAIAIPLFNTAITIGTLSRRMVTKEDVQELIKTVNDLKADFSEQAQKIAVLEYKVDSTMQENSAIRKELNELRAQKGG
jgi:uncharacterized protein YigA (DUF484 family)